MLPTLQRLVRTVSSTSPCGFRQRPSQGMSRLSELRLYFRARLGGIQSSQTDLDACVILGIQVVLRLSTSGSGKKIHAYRVCTSNAGVVMPPRTTRRLGIVVDLSKGSVLAPFTPANPHGTQMGTWRAEAGQRFPSLVVWTSIPVCNICRARGGDGNTGLPWPVELVC
jgi:hypothetical protein